MAYYLFDSQRRASIRLFRFTQGFGELTKTFDTFTCSLAIAHISLEEWAKVLEQLPKEAFEDEEENTLRHPKRNTGGEQSKYGQIS